MMKEIHFFAAKKIGVWQILMLKVILAASEMVVCSTIVIQSVCPEIAKGAIILKLIGFTFSRERLRSSTDHACMQRKLCNGHG